MIEVHYVMPSGTLKVRHADYVEFSTIARTAQGLKASSYVVRANDNHWNVFLTGQNGPAVKRFPSDQLDGAIMWARHRQ